ncbi:MAG: hypothetical protein ACK506_12580 [Pirellula sp.]|jgi:hypothetical protein
MYNAIKQDRVETIIGKPLITRDVMDRGLQYAFTDNKKEAFSTLLDSGANPDTYIFHELGWRRIGAYAIESEDSFWLEKLISHGMTLSKIGQKGHPALIRSFYASRPMNSKLLIEYGADIYTTDHPHEPLGHAALARETESLELLILFGVDLNPKCKFEHSFFAVYRNMRWYDPIGITDTYDVLCLDFNAAIRECNLDPNEMRFSGGTDEKGVWEFAKLRPDEEQTFDIRKPFVELRLKRPESIYNDPEKWGIAEKLKPFLPSQPQANTHTTD